MAIRVTAGDAQQRHYHDAGLAYGISHGEELFYRALTIADMIDAVECGYLFGDGGEAWLSSAVMENISGKGYRP